jgi:two-component system OmpR family sensor kinase
VALAALVAADVATYSALRSFLLSRVDQELQASHQQIEPSLRSDLENCHSGPQPGPGPGGPGQPATFEGSVSQTFIEVRSSSGQVLCSVPIVDRSSGKTLSPRLPAKVTDFSRRANPGGEPAAYFNAPSAQQGGPEFRVRAGNLGNETLFVAAPLSDTLATLHRLLLIELAVTGGALLLAALIGWWLVHLGLRPLRDIERTAGAIAQGDLSHRVPGENPNTEVGRLARALNVMLGRIQSAFAARDATEAALRQSEGRLRRFAADASHELRTPLAAVSAYAELFERGAESRPEDLARVMKGIRQETSRMGSLVEDLLLLARLDERLPMEVEPLDLVALAGEAIESAGTVGPEWPVRLVADHPVEIRGDRRRLRQVLDNLLANVRSHTPPGTETTVTIRDDGNYAVCEVADNGPGITAEQASRLFERFYRADPSRSRASGGAGLGLSIVAAIVGAHGGDVQASPGPSGGAVFSFRLPVAGPTSA